ncbi:hypothetical protein NIES2130_17660 [Scytonema sp. HK-05]|nr:hypothetical protein NIES2130_17660 [Scytonema sp. HK-05]
MHPESMDSLSLNCLFGGNSPDADLSGSGVRPLAAFKVEPNLLSADMIQRTAEGAEEDTSVQGFPPPLESVR